MYWQGTGSAIALAYGEVKVGMSFVQGPQWPYKTNPVVFTPGVTYTVTAVYHQPDTTVVAPSPDNSAPTPWDSDAGLPNTVDSPGYVQFTNDLAGSFGAAGNWIPTTFLANAYRIG